MSDEILKKTDKKKKIRPDGKELNSNKYIELRPTMEQVKNLCETIMNMEFMVVDESNIDTIDLISYVIEDSYEDFAESLPLSLANESEILFDMLKEHVEDIETFAIINESRVLSLAQRKKKAMLIRRHKAKILTAKKRSERRRATTDQIERRANRKARLSIKKRFTGKKSYNSMSPSEKMAVDKRMERMPKSVLQRLTTKMIPKVKQAETERLRNANKNKDDSKSTKTISSSSSTNKTTNKIGFIKQDKKAKPKSIQEELLNVENFSDINNIFENEFMTKKDLPKK